MVVPSPPEAPRQGALMILEGSRAMSAAGMQGDQAWRHEPSAASFRPIQELTRATTASYARSPAPGMQPAPPVPVSEEPDHDGVRPS